LNPFHIWYAQEVRNYSLMILFAILGLGAVMRVDDAVAPLRRVWGLAGVWIGGLLSNLSFSFQITAAGVWGLIRFRKRKPALLTMALAAAITLTACLPWIVQFYERRVMASHLLRLTPVPMSERIRGEASAPILGLPYAAYALSVGFSLGPSLRELRKTPSLEIAQDHPVAIAATALSSNSRPRADSLAAGDPRPVSLLALGFVAVGSGGAGVQVLNPATRPPHSRHILLVRRPPRPAGSGEFCSRAPWG
jgi:hypothetical protein